MERADKLKALGITDDPEAAQVIAETLLGPYHFVEFLKAIEPANRRNVYEAVKPFLKFKPQSWLTIKGKLWRN